MCYRLKQLPLSLLFHRNQVARAREEFIKKGGKKEKNEDFPDAQTKEVSQVLMFNGTDSHDMEFTRMNAGELLIQTDFTSNFFLKIDVFPSRYLQLYLPVSFERSYLPLLPLLLFVALFHFSVQTDSVPLKSDLDGWGLLFYFKIIFQKALIPHSISTFPRYIYSFTSFPTHPLTRIYRYSPIIFLHFFLIAVPAYVLSGKDFL